MEVRVAGPIFRSFGKSGWRKYTQESNTIVIVLKALAASKLSVTGIPEANLEAYRFRPKFPPIDHTYIV